jgi:glycosyltransferase involved in cell wall biosynthesis
MKILLCTNTFNDVTNGPTKFANILLQINDLYDNAEIRILTEDVPCEKKYVYKLKLQYPMILNFASQFFRIFFYYRESKKIRETFPFDVVVYNNAIIGCLSCFDKKFKTVGMINDDNNIYFKDKMLSKFFLKHMIFRFLERFSAYHSAAIIVNSNYLKDTIEKEYKIDTSKVARMYKAIELSTAKFRLREKISDPIEILFVKNDFRRGGLYNLVNAIRLLTNYKFTLHIVGPDIQFDEEINQIYSGVTNLTVNNYNHKSQKFVFELMKNVDIFSVPSIQEALGVANIEAISYGVPVVSTNAGGIPEVLDYGNNGWLVEPNNIFDLANKISECIENDKERIARSQRGIVFINRFSATNMFANFFKILSDVVEKE